jgi:hypothetical protein
MSTAIICPGPSAPFSRTFDSDTLKRPFAYVAGSVVQLLAIATGFLVPIMFFLGVIFAALWITAIFVARRVEGVT